jgi:hypothetical protein
MRWWVWVLFATVQCTGCTLVFLDRGPCAGMLLIPGLILLLPGDLLGLILIHPLHDLPNWVGIAIAAILILGANAFLWYLASRIKRELGTSD